MALYYQQTSATGTSGDDMFLGGSIGSGIRDWDGGDGNDVMHADTASVFQNGAATTGAAQDIAAGSSGWLIRPNPETGDDAIASAMVFVQGNGGPLYWAVSVAAGDTVTFDIDYGDGWGGSEDTALILYDTDGTTQLALEDGSQISDGGTGSTGSGGTFSNDAYLSYTFTTAGTYYIRVTGEEGAHMPVGADALMHVSHTGVTPTGTLGYDQSTLSGGNGDDTIYGYLDAANVGDLIYGGSGNDTLYSNGLNDTIYGGIGDDIIDVTLAPSPSSVNDFNGLIEAGDGNDIVRVDGIAPTGATVDGEQGDDLLVMNVDFGSEIVLLDMQSGAIFFFDPVDGYYATGIEIKNFEDLTLTNNPLTLFQLNSNSKDNVIELRGSTIDSIDGKNGDDRIFTFAGNDSLYGSAGNDTLDAGSGNDRVYGGADNDALRGRGGNDTLYGGDGDDLLSGGNDSDIIYGDAGSNTLLGQGGDDQLIVGAYGGIASGGAGADLVFGGGGDDLLRGQGGGDGVYGGGGNDTAFGGSGSDLITGGDGNDILYGQGNGDTIQGDAGNDKIFGGAGSDFIRGMGGDDLIYGGTSRDTLTGGAGDDTLSGGSGPDVFIFELGSEQDRINAYDTGFDELQIDADLVGGTAPTDIAQFITDYATANGTGTILSFDFGGGDVLELQIAAGFDLAALALDISFV
ncbi:calcium-binding protein [Octadecabacter sp. R77987]|uniref:calcium-binding protein n=1 Tax=Octadecabacter sp. R77987 TaxID=3093874 RepID=UPI00366ABE33